MLVIELAATSAATSRFVGVGKPGQRAAARWRGSLNQQQLLRRSQGMAAAPAALSGAAVAGDAAAATLPATTVYVTV